MYFKGLITIPKTNRESKFLLNCFFWKKIERLPHTSPANEASDCLNLTLSSMSSNFFWYSSITLVFCLKIPEIPRFIRFCRVGSDRNWVTLLYNFLASLYIKAAERYRYQLHYIYLKTETQINKIPKLCTPLKD